MALKKVAKKNATKKTSVRKAPAKQSTKKKTTAKSSKKATLKTKPTAMSVRGFIDSVENETRRRDANTVLALMKKVTGETPKMWGPTIIGFGEYHYVYESGREGDMLNVGFSPRKANMVLYVMGSIPDDDPLVAKLGKHKTGKACLYINKLDDIDLKTLEKMIKKSYLATKKKYKS